MKLAGFLLSFPLIVLISLNWFSATPEIKESSFNYFNGPESAFRAKGVNLVAPPNPFPDDPMVPLTQIGANWVAVVPYAYSRPGQPFVRYNSEWQWWGERPAGAEETIKLAKKAGHRVMLKPQVYVPGSWTGGLDYDSDEAWKKWEYDYEVYIMEFAKMAAALDVEVFCIGTEFKVSTKNRAFFWRALIQKIRKIYPGKLVYAANWDEFEQVPFWEDLDLIGIDAYFPLIEEPTPSVEALKKAWKPWLLKIRKLQAKVGKPLLFTEFGYLSVDGCAYNTWELEAKIKQLPINQKAQHNALDALFQTFWPEPYWMGGFLWKWFPNMQGHEGYLERDYTPQHKQAMEVLEKWYQKK